MNDTAYESFHIPTSGCLVFFSETVYVSPAIKCTNNASFSCILTVANYMSENYPNLPPPEFPADHIIPDTEKSIEEKKAMKIYFEPWCDYFNHFMEDNHEKG